MVWNWWRSELSELAVPLMTTRRPTANHIVVDLRRDGVRVLREVGSQLQPLAAGSDATMPLAAAGPLLKLHAAGRPIVVRLQSIDCLIREVELPRSARADFASILRLQLERVSPFRPADLAEAHIVLGPGGQPGTLAVQHLAARRSTFEPIVRELERQGIPVAAVDCRNPTGTTALAVDFLAPPAPTNAGTRWHWPAAAAVFLLTAALVGDTWRHDAVLARLTAETLAVRPKVQALQRTVEQAEAAARDGDAVRALRNLRPPVTIMLEELTRLLPDTATLQHVRFERDAVDIAGTALSAVALLPLIEASRHFQDARLTGPISTEQDGRERFAMRFQLRRASLDVSAAPGGRT